MSTDLLDQLHRLRALTRSTTVLFAAAASGGLFLLPMAYRGQAGAQWVLIVPTLLYLGLAAFRLVGGFQSDRQLEFEERFVRFADSQKKLLASAQGAGKLWKMSGLVQGLVRAGRGAVPERERRSYVRRSLTATCGFLLPPAVRMAVPSAILVALCWVVVAVVQPGARGLYLYVGVVPGLLLVGWSEWRIGLRRARLDALLSQLLDGVAVRAVGEWGPFLDYDSASPYRHRMLYMDPVLSRLGEEEG